MVCVCSVFWVCWVMFLSWFSVPSFVGSGMGFPGALGLFPSALGAVLILVWVWGWVCLC